MARSSHSIEEFSFKNDLTIKHGKQAENDTIRHPENGPEGI